MLCLIDPALQDHAGTPSTNLGDVVIYRAILSQLNRFFPGEEICRISSHEPLEEEHYEQIEKSRLMFLGGSNLLSSDLLTYNQWNFAKDPSNYERPRFKDAILFGIGWWQYQDAPTSFTADFYRRILHPEQLHSVRDGYTAARLKDIGFSNVVNTGCPSMWGLDGIVADRTVRWTEDCVLMLTDYYTHPAEDERILSLALEHFKNIFFFPQGTGDIAYLNTLPSFQAHSRRFEMLDHSLEALEQFLDQERVTYFGTRLHGGITALKHGAPSLILGVDNRSLEKARDFNLPVIPRRDPESIEKWLRGELRFPKISVPHEDIARWCEQFTVVEHSMTRT
jgi:hypothetical protein